jgi:hypothetical protein
VHITCTGNKEKDSAHNLILGAENLKSKEGAHKLKISHNLTMCWKASAHNLQIWGNTWVLYCSVLLLYSTNPESWNNKN